MISDWMQMVKYWSQMNKLVFSVDITEESTSLPTKIIVIKNQLPACQAPSYVIVILIVVF